MVHASATDLLTGHIASFERHAEQGDPDVCWPWRGSFDRYGYGTIRASQTDGQRRRVGAHRVAYLLLRGPIPSNLVLDHLCRNRGCVNPWHLEPVTNHVNTLRQRASGKCRSGAHQMTPANTYEHNGHRRCRECMRAGFRRANRKRRGGS